MSALRRIRGWLLPVVVIAGMGLLVARVAGGRSASSTKEPAKAPKETAPVMVTTDPVTARPVQRRVAVVGSLWGRDEIGVMPKVEGRIAKVRKYVGDSVRPGDVLFEIEDTNYKLAVEEARRSLELELAKVGRAEPPPADFNVRDLPSVKKAEAQERLAQANRERLRRLKPPATATQEETDKADAELAIAQAATKQAVFEAETVLAQVRHKQAQLATARQRLEDTKVVVPSGAEPAEATSSAGPAPVEYLVAERAVSAGDTVSALASAKPAYRLVIADPLKLLITIPERYAGEVRADQEVEVYVETHPRETFRGTVARVNPTVDRASRTFQAEVVIPNPQRRLKAGSFAKAAILTRVDDQALTVPEEALAKFGGATKVYVLRGEKVAEVAVEPGERLDVEAGDRSRAWVEVRGDLKKGEPVVTSGQSKLVDGSLAKVRPASVKE